MPYHILFPHFTQRNSLFAIFQSLLCSLIFRPYAASVALYHLLSSVLAVVLLYIYEMGGGVGCLPSLLPCWGSACCVLAVVAPSIYKGMGVGYRLIPQISKKSIYSITTLMYCYIWYINQNISLFLHFYYFYVTKKTGYRKIAHLIHIHSLTASSSASRFSQIT